VSARPWVVLAAVGFAATSWAARPYRGGAVASAHPAASEAAVEMLNKGGNAVDAAVAAAFTLAVVGPYHSGLGGGGFALTYQAGASSAEVLDFREVAPKAATPDMYLKDGEVVPGRSTDGALSVAVPGAAKGYLELHQKGGKLPRATVLAPAIRAAERGFWVTPKYRAMAQERVECLRADAEAARLFLRPGPQGALEPPSVGTVLRQPELAKTLQALSGRGAAAFYQGPIAKAVVNTVRERGGILSLEDLANYRTQTRMPLEGRYRGHRVLTMPPPSAGGLAIVQSLGALERLEPKALAYREPQRLHHLAELWRRTYVDRARYLGDPAFVEIPLAKLSSADYLAQLASGIDRARATPSTALSPHAPKEPMEQKNTTHISVIDRQGNAVALTTTLNYGFGSCLVAKGTGVLLNDEMDDFAAKPLTPNVYGLVTGKANAIAPGKIPLSSMSPTLVFQKDRPTEVMLAVGSPGGSTIPTTVMQVILNVVDHQMDIVRAVGAGRVHHQYLPDALVVDAHGADPRTREALAAMGHTLEERPRWGDAEAVFVSPESGLRYAASDPRNEGAALGQD
jgi:gamma-glutamyltranspeptidase / glutathione hydrolase